MVIHTKYKVGDRVIVISDCKSKNKHGTIYALSYDYEKTGHGYISVKLDNGRKRTIFYWNMKLENESEDNSMEKLTGFKKVAVVEISNGYSGTKDYHFALYDESIVCGDKVLVTGSATGQMWTVKDIIDYDEEIIIKNITAEVICKVDTSSYDERCANRKKAEELRKQMDKKRKEIEARKDDEYYASLDEDYKAMLEQMKKMVG